MFKLPKQAEKRNPIVGALLGVLLTAFFGLCYNQKTADIPGLKGVYSFIDNLEFKSLDLRFVLRGSLPTEKVNQDIVLLDMDDETLEWRTFPFDRLLYTEIVRALGQENAKTIVTFFDIFFYNPSGRALDEEMAGLFAEKMNKLIDAISSNDDVVMAMKQDMYALAEKLLAGIEPSEIPAVIEQIKGILENPALQENMQAFQEAADFLNEQQEMKDLAPDRDIVFREVNEFAGNVFLAQTFETQEDSPYGVQAFVENEDVRNIFVRMILSGDYTNTKTDTEVKVSTAIRNMTADMLRAILKGAEEKSKGGKGVFGKEVVQKINAEIATIENKRKTTEKLSSRFSFADKSSLGEPLEKLKNIFPGTLAMDDIYQIIGEFAKGAGNVKPEFQSDGNARAAAPVSFFYDAPYPHVSLFMAMEYLGISQKDAVIYADKIVLKNCRKPGEKETFTVTIPLFRKGSMLINWAGKFYDPTLFPHRSFKVVYENAKKYNLYMKAQAGEELNDIERAALEALTEEDIAAAKKEIEFFKGKVALVGLTAKGTHDMNPMPFEGRYPLVGLHANFINTIVERLFIKTAPFGLFIGVSVALGLLIGLIGGSKKQGVGALVTVGATALYFGSCYLLFVNRVWLPMVPPIMGMWATYLFIVVYRYMTEGQEAKKMKAMFSNYVSASVVDTLIARPDMLKLGGERMDLTAMFAFATGPGIDEIESAEELVDILNEYFTAMTDPIFEHNGMLDKYEGYIIMAVYGCPVPYGDHATKACFSCVDMLKKLDELNKKWAGEGKKPIHVNIGLNTGSMIAGNMGSRSRFNYTVMGDSVNLSARLMGASMQYHTPTMISEFTYEGAKNDIIARFVDKIVVVGKEIPIDTYEIIGRKGDALPDNVVKGMEAFDKGIELYRQRKWDDAIASFKRCLELIPEDGPSPIYIDRCELYKENPPPEDWDGEFKMTKKFG